MKNAYLTRFRLHHIRVLLIKTNSSGRKSISNQINPEKLDLDFVIGGSSDFKTLTFAFKQNITI